MKPRRTGRILLAVLLVLAGAAAVAISATGRVPHIRRTVASIASSVAVLAAPPDDSVPTATEAGAPDAAPPRRQAAPLSSAQLGAPLVNGRFVVDCGAPDDMKVTVTLAVRMGRAVNVKVKTQPPDPTVASCVERATRSFQWDISPRRSSLTVRY